MVKLPHMQLSIIIPVYNAEKFLAECVQSIFEQNIPQENFEVILINDGSTDSSLEICQKLTQRHKNIRVLNQKNKGQSIARNIGMTASKGEYIFFIDSDDYIKSGYLNNFLSIVKKKDLDFLGFGTYNTSQKYTGNPSTMPLELEVEGSGLYIISKHNYYNGSCWFIFKKSIAKNLYFEEGRLCEDVIFTTQLLLRVSNGQVYKNEIYGYRLNNDSTLRTKQTERLHKINDDMFYTVKRLGEIIDTIDFQEHKESFDRLKKRQESYTYFAIIRFIRGKRKFNELKQHLYTLENCKHQGYPIKNFKGYTFRDKILVRCLNSKLFLYFVTKLNCYFSFIN